MSEVKSSMLLLFFLFAYVIAAGFTDILNLPVVGSKIQIPEIIFIPLFLIWLIKYGDTFSINRIKIDKLQLSILLFLAVVLVSTLISDESKSWMELIGLIYLFLVFIVFSTSLRSFKKPDQFIQEAFVTCGIIAAISGMIGWFLAMIRIESVLAMPADVHYPYLGYIARATGFMDSPNMLFNLLGVCILIYLPTWLDLPEKKFKHYVIICILMIGAILTFSKSILLLIAATIFILYQRRNRSAYHKKFIATASAIFLFIIWMIGSHVLVRKNNDIDWTQRKERAYTHATPFYSAGEYQFYKTNYTINKESALTAGFRNPVFGVGPGNFNQFVGQLKEEGRYPAYFINFDPHSTYLGAFAEIGLLGFLALMFLGFQIFRSIQKAIAHNQIDGSFLISIMACFLFMALEAISMDILNFRHLWILIGVLSLSLHLPKTTQNQQATK